MHFRYLKRALRKPYLRIMNFFKRILSHLVIQIVYLFVVFHLFWLVFNFLSENYYLMNGLWKIYLKTSAINSIGFIAFCIAGYWTFNKYITSKKIVLPIISVLFVCVSLGYFQYRAQDWQLGTKRGDAKSSSITKVKGSVISKAIPLKQPVGAPVRAMLNIFVYQLLGIGFAYMKDWRRKDKQATILEKEKLAAELSLLRYQLNPHFLFNTINNIYYLAIMKSEKTADAILKVSDLFRYILYEKEEEVLLEKEIKYLMEFIDLQQFRFPDQKLSIEIDVSSDVEQLRIAPLLLVTFLENAYKHGEPGTEEQPLQVKLSVRDKTFTYSVINRINKNKSTDMTPGIGINNLKRRIFLLYPGKHVISLVNENDIFRAYLQIELA